MDLSLTIIAVDDHAAITAFWSDFTGWHAEVHVPGVYAEYRSPNGMRFGVYAREHFPGNYGGTATELARGEVQPFEVYLTVDDAQAEAERAVTLGGTLLSAAADRAWGDTVAYVLTPGGGRARACGGIEDPVVVPDEWRC